MTTWCVCFGLGPWRSTHVVDAPTRGLAIREAAEPVECGGNVWDTDDGLPPDELVELGLGYEVLFCVEAARWPAFLDLIEDGQL